MKVGDKVWAVVGEGSEPGYVLAVIPVPEVGAHAYRVAYLWEDEEGEPELKDDVFLLTDLEPRA